MGLKYIGNGSFVINVPARDLTDAETNEFGRDMLLATGLYVDAEGTRAQDVQKSKAKKDGDA